MARNRPAQALSFHNPKYAFIPRQSIESLRIITGGNSAVATYTAPTGDACYFYVGGTAPSSTLDATDVSDGGGELSRQVVLTGLTPATDYHFRLTCGAR